MTATPVRDAAGDPPPHRAGAPAAAEPLLDADWVLARVGTPGLVLLHVDADSSGYHAAHPAGALPLDAHDDLHDPVRRGPVTQQAFEAGNRAHASASATPP